MAEARPPAALRWRRLLARRRTRVLLALVLSLIVVRMALPAVLRRVVVAQADKAMIGRIEIDDIDLALLTGGFTLHGLRVFSTEATTSGRSRSVPSTGPSPSAGEPGEPAPSAAPATPPEAGAGPPGSAPVLSAKRLMVKLGLRALFRRTVEVRRFELDGVAVSLDRAQDGTLVLPAAAPAPEPTAAPQAAGPGWGVLVQSVALHDGRIGFRDFAIGDPPQRIDVTLPEVDASQLALLITENGLQPGKVALDAGIQDGTLHLDAKLEYLDAGPAYESHLVLTNVPIADSRVYIPKVGWSGLTGRLDADLVHRFESQGAHTVHGKAALRDLDVRVAGLDDPALAWKTLAVDVGGIDFVAQHADVAAVTLDGARIVTRPGGPDPLPVVQGLMAAASEHVAAAEPSGRPTPAASAPPAGSASPAVLTSPAAAPPSTPVAVPDPPPAPTPVDSPPSPAAAAAAEPANEPSQTASPAVEPPSRTTEPAPVGSTAPPSAVVTSAAAKPWTWTIGKVALTDAHVQAIGGDGAIGVGLDADVAPLTSAPGKAATLHVSLAPSSGGTVDVSGDLVPAPLAFDGKLAVKALHLAPLTQPVATAATRLAKSATADLDLTIAAGATSNAPPDGVRVSGTIGLSDVDVAGDDANAFAVRWKSLTVALSSVTAPGVLKARAAPPGPFEATFGAIILTQPDVTVTRTADGIVLPAPFGAPATSTSPPVPAATPAAAGAATEPQPKPAVRVHADRVTIEKMRLATTDATVQPFFHSTLDPVDLTATAVAWPGPAVGDLKLVAKNADGGVLTITGTVAPARTKLVAKLADLALAPFNPYAASTGYGVTGGTARLESTITLGSGAYDTKSHLVLHQLGVTTGEGDTLFTSKFGMPLELALSLLTDLQGNIVLDLPITGDAKGTHTEVGTLLATALTRAILNAVTSPLKLIGAVAHIGEKPAALTPQPLVFAPGRAALVPGEAAKLASLGSLLGRAPGLRLHLRGEAGDTDRRWLQEQALRAKLEQESGVLGSVRHIAERGARKAVLAALTARAEGKPGDVPAEHREWFDAAVAEQRVDDATLRQLADARTADVQKELASSQGVDAGRVVIDDARTNDPAARPAVAVGLGAPAPVGAAASAAIPAPTASRTPAPPARTPARRARR